MYKKFDANDAAALGAIVGAENLLIGDAISEDCSHDELGGVSHMPDALVFAHSTEEVSAVMKYAYRENIPVTVRGSGTGTLSVPIPFEPDTLLIVAANMRIFTCQIAVCVYTPHALGKYLGGVQTTQSSLSLGMAAIRRDQRLVSYADGVLTFTMIESVPVRFDANTDYIVLASKTETRTDKEILTDFIAGLADAGGTVTLSQEAINAAVTDDEWATLLATKPNWTFTLI